MCIRLNGLRVSGAGRAPGVFGLTKAALIHLRPSYGGQERARSKRWRDSAAATTLHVFWKAACDASRRVRATSIFGRGLRGRGSLGLRKRRGVPLPAAVQGGLGFNGSGHLPQRLMNCGGPVRLRAGKDGKAGRNPALRAACGPVPLAVLRDKERGIQNKVRRQDAALCRGAAAPVCGWFGLENGLSGLGGLGGLRSVCVRFTKCGFWGEKGQKIDLGGLERFTAGGRGNAECGPAAVKSTMAGKVRSAEWGQNWFNRLYSALFAFLWGDFFRKGAEEARRLRPKGQKGQKGRK